MKHLFVPYILALLAKEKGFNEDCLMFYYHQELNSDNIFKQYPEHCVDAPLYQQLIDWFRGKHNIIITIQQAEARIRAICFYGFINDCRSIDSGQFKTEAYLDYYEALNKAIEESFVVPDRSDKELTEMITGKKEPFKDNRGATLGIEKEVINPHWDKVLRRKHQLSDDVLGTIKSLMFDTSLNYMQLRSENESLKLKIQRIKDQL